VGAQTLLSGNPATAVPSVAAIAAQFGSRHVHIVTNSKGGLFTRAFLDLNAGLDPPSQTGVISVTTLDTPHHGSVLSDTVVAYNSGVHSVLPGYARVGYLFGRLFTPQQLKNAFGTGNKDMTVAQVEQFNGDHPYPPREYHVQMQDQSGHTSNLTIKNPSYYSTSGNADLNSDHFLQDSEAAPYNPFVARFQWNRIGTVAEITLGTDSQGRTVATQITNAGFFAENDTAVSIVSARYPPPSPVFTGFTEINSYRANHASVLCPQAGPQPLFCAGIPGPIVDVLASIRKAEQDLDEEIK
jgi:triacylglycerol esterase/lipase EstA (alpha/beta hydrolase family)